jgi:putative membrane protein
MMGYGAGMGWGAWMFMGLFWLVLLGVILFLVVRLLPGSGSGGAAGRTPQDSPEDILDRRFARGEIDLETYQAQRAALAQARGKR